MSQVIPLGPAARMLTTREAATRLGVSLRTIQLWVEADILPAARTPGGHRRIPYNAVEALALSTGLGGDSSTKVAISKRDLLAASKTADAPASPDEPRGRALDVLLVADDQKWQDDCAAALAMFGPAVELRTAETGYLALLQIGQKAPDVLITNLELPGLDGIAMLRTLERCESISNLRVLALTDLTDSELMRKGGLPASAEVVRSPVSAEAIALRVSRFLVGQRASL
ncbi:MAG: excisionase family DNA-binding protein [Burkholderiales bacterium]|nr:excisionase family DNA-binding protein [Burkholderiales bacterium]MDE2078562.1 excisionase family DNA-binding protein [Burkholderiales bacterium]MDE2434423.1 excisionase family DNA-binding protein [Burkholderiales bacterium]